MTTRRGGNDATGQREKKNHIIAQKQSHHDPISHDAGQVGNWKHVLKDTSPLGK